jgi:uncharacterized protein (TIGR00661 family)
MRILLAVQGTGNGHISRARDIIPLLQKYGDLDIAISGIQADVALDYPIKYQFYGFSFIFGTKGGVNQWETLKKSKLIRLWKDIHNFPVQNYDLIINDFEPVVAWACRIKKKPCIALSHQSSFLSKKTPRPQNRWNWAEWILKYYAPSHAAIGFHFESYDQFIHTPVIREEIRNRTPSNLGHYTVYLPAFGDHSLIEFLSQIPEVHWEVFSKHSKKDYTVDHIHIQPIQNYAYNQSLLTCTGLLTGGGFEGPAEALFLGKKLFSIPMKGQWEQQCNSAAMEKLGVPVFWDLKGNLPKALKDWVLNSKPIQVNFPNETQGIIAGLVEKYGKNG